MTLSRLAVRSLLNRRFTSALTVLTIALSVFLLLGVERVRTETREGFTSTISGTDLLVGARSGSLPLLLYSVFHIGDATNNISWRSYLEIAALAGVSWTVPISLGDSHRGYRVMGTNSGYFEHYRYARDRALAFASGGVFDDLYDAVIGADVARRLGYETGDSIVIAHGAGSANVLEHGDKPFTVSGVLAPTGTPVDRTVIVSLEGIEAIHIDWSAGVPAPGSRIDAQQTRRMDLTPEAVTAVLVGVTSKVQIFKLQRLINEYPHEPLLAVLPGVALAELWRVMGVAERALFAVSVMVVLVGVAGMVTALLTGLEERRREMAVLRSVGARPLHVVILLVSEATLLVVAGILGGLVFLYAGISALAPTLADTWGVHLAARPPGASEFAMLAGVLFAGIIAGLVPGIRAYRNSLSDGLTVKL